MSFDKTFSSDNWHRDAPSIARRNGIRSRRWGMRVTVFQGPSSGDYVLSYGLSNTNIQDNSNWLKVSDIGDVWGDAAAGITTADNGLTVTGSNVQLGGTLIHATNIDGTQDFNFGINTALNQFTVSTDTTSQLNSFGNVQLDAADFVQITGGTNVGITAAV
jgi:hypothetical protein